MTYMHADPVRDADARGDQEALAIERRIAFHEALLRDVVKALRKEAWAKVYVGSGIEPITALQIVERDVMETSAGLRMMLEVVRRVANGKANEDVTRDLANACLQTIADRFTDHEIALLEERGAFIGDDA